VADAQVRGLMMGIGHETDAKMLTHAVLDGVAFAFRDCLEALKAAGTTLNRITAVGGGTHSELWLKIMATVLDMPIDLPTAGDFGGAFGAARLGLIAATGADYRKVCTPPKTAKTIKPERKLTDAYEQAYRRYVQIYPAIKEITWS
jgi:xylulokinase